MRFARTIAVGAVALMASSLGATAAYADDTSSGETIVVGGQELGPEDGLRVTTESWVVPSGGEEVGATYSSPSGGMSTQAVWGSSFAYSREILQLGYIGYAKAGGNIY